MRAYRATIIAGLAVALVVVTTFALVGRAMRGGGDGSALVRVHDGDGATHEYSLDADGDHVITTSLGTNTIRVRDGAASMADADCPNQSCLQQEPLTHPGPQIICLPHKLWVEVVRAGDADTGSLDENLVAWSDTDDFDTVAR